MVVGAVVRLSDLARGRDVTAHEIVSSAPHQELRAIFESLASQTRVLAVNAVNRENTGRTVAEGASPEEILLRTVEMAPPSPSSLAPETPRELDELVTRCLASAPDDRPDSALSLMEQLDALASQYSWSESDARAWWASHVAPSDHRSTSARG